MTDSFPRQSARTQFFSLGAPRSFQVSPRRRHGRLPPLSGRHRPGDLPVGAGRGHGQRAAGRRPGEARRRGARGERAGEGAPGAGARERPTASSRSRPTAISASPRSRWPGSSTWPTSAISGTVCALPGPDARRRPSARSDRRAGGLRQRGRAAGGRHVATGEDRALAEPAAGTDGPGSSPTGWPSSSPPRRWTGPRLLVVAGRHRGAGRPGGRGAGAAPVHRRPGQPPVAARARSGTRRPAPPTRR